MASYRFRRGKITELETLIAIDDRASQLYCQAGLHFDFKPDHPYVIEETRKWKSALEQGLTQVATDDADLPLGFVVCNFVDNQPYLDQISVCPEHMRRGLGAKLLEWAISWSAERSLWLTTYSHLAWNKAYYEERGFVQIGETSCGAQMQAILKAQREALPAPDKRILMVRHPPNSRASKKR